MNAGYLAAAVARQIEEDVMSRWGRGLKPWQTQEQVSREERERKAVMAGESFSKTGAARQVSETAGSVAVLEPPTSAAVQVEDANVFDMEAYEKLVRELNVDDSAVRNYRLREVLASEHIEVYDYRRVEEFMNAKVKAEAKKHGIEYLTWIWKPISEQYPDLTGSFVDASLEWHGRSQEVIISFLGRPGSVAAERTSRTYTRPIPQAVLETVKAIRDRFPDAAFYASDYAVKDPDPFLMVTGRGLDRYVVARWDEPTFRS